MWEMMKIQRQTSWEDCLPNSKWQQLSFIYNQYCVLCSRGLCVRSSFACAGVADFVLCGHVQYIDTILFLLKL